MKKIILGFPKQFKIGSQSAKKTSVTGNFNKLLICGMGGSALPGDILRMLAKDFKVNFPVYIHRTYNLPYWVNKKCLIVCISYSGNTEETLSAFKEACRRNFQVTAVTSGGRLAKLCRNNKVPLAKVPLGYPPRMALGFQFSALMQILVNCQMIKDNLKTILSLERRLKPEQLEKKGKNLASKIKDKIPLIYSSYSQKELSRIWKIKLNESSKVLAFSNYFPELNHNEITGFENPQGKSHVIILRDPANHPRNKKRMRLTATILKKKKIPVDFVDIQGKDILYKIFSNLLLADWVSYYLALEYGINPIPVKLQEEFKKKLK